LKLAGATVLVLTPVAVVIARYLAWRRTFSTHVLGVVVMLPLVLPPTVLGYYLLVGFGRDGLFGAWFYQWSGTTLAFSFEGLLIASLIFNLPFAVQPAQRAFEGINREVRESAWCCGLGGLRTFFRIELPLAWSGVLGSVLLTFAHTLGEFGVVLMVGGNIPGETRTISIAIFDRVESFDSQGAAVMSGALLVFSALVIGCLLALNSYRRINHEH
jgi:molybdate transport system permease protein